MAPDGTWKCPASQLPKKQVAGSDLLWQPPALPLIYGDEQSVKVIPGWCNSPSWLYNNDNNDYITIKVILFLTFIFQINVSASTDVFLRNVLTLLHGEKVNTFLRKTSVDVETSIWNINTHTHTTILLLFWNMSGTTRVSRYQKGKTSKGKTNLDLLEQEIVSGSGICWAMCNAYSLRPPARSPPLWATHGFTSQFKIWSISFIVMSIIQLISLFKDNNYSLRTALQLFHQ